MKSIRHLLLVCGLTSVVFGEASELKSSDNEPVEKLSAFSVIAGRIPTGMAPGAILNSVEILSTPGATADINRSLQTFPGVQQVDEGNALFVRGGDSIETATLVNGIRYPAATRISAPTGSFSGSLDPMQARTITFLNGGLSAQYSNALSGIVDLTTYAAPSSTSEIVNVALGAVGGTANIAFGHRAGVRATAVKSSTAPIFGLNGSTHDYTDKPHGHDLSATAAWGYRSGGEVRAYAFDQQNKFGLLVDQPNLRGIYQAHVHSQFATLSWGDQFGDWKWNANTGSTRLWREQTISGATIKTGNEQQQASVLATFDVSGQVALKMGGEFNTGSFTLEKSKTESGQLLAFRRNINETRCGVFVQADAVVARHVRAIIGGRIDHSTLTEETTVDPRLSLAWEPRKTLSFSLAGGSYHQVPDGYYFISANGAQIVRPAMRARDAVVAVEYRHESQVLRVEVYQKHYGAIAQLDRNYVSVPASGTGSAQGVDVFFKTSLPAEFSGRVTCNFVNAERTDPNTGRMASAPWNVTQSVSLILDRTVAGWHTSFGLRYASGRPITPVVGGTPDGVGSWAPIYGEPLSERVRPQLRLDFLIYRVWSLDAHRSMTTFLSINNVLNRTNIYSYNYSEDFSQRWNAPSLFNRVIYFGAMFYFN
jgi:outer membrane cobalamin receptor